MKDLHGLLAGLFLLRHQNEILRSHHLAGSGLGLKPGLLRTSVVFLHDGQTIQFR